MTEIFKYSDSHTILKTFWMNKKSTHSKSYSLRAWSLKLNFSSHSLLYQMMNGQRKIPIKYIPTFVKEMGLMGKEALYFESLVCLENSKKAIDKDFYLKKIKKITKGLPKREEMNSYQFFENPLHIIIAEMTYLPGFELKASWIKSQLGLKLTALQINQAINSLLSLGVLKKTTSGKLAKQWPHQTNPSDIVNLGVQKLHSFMSKLASEQVFEQPVEQRQYGSFCFCIDPEDLPQAKEEIKNFAENFIARYENTKASNRKLYQLNTRFFSLSKGEK